MDEARIGIIGGSGLYDMPLEESRMLRVPTPFGDPSDSYLLGNLEGQPVAFLLDMAEDTGCYLPS